MNISPLEKTILKKINEGLGLKFKKLREVDLHAWNPLAYVLTWNNAEKIGLTEKEMNYLIRNSDLNRSDSSKPVMLMYAFFSNEEELLNLTESQIDYLVKNSDLLATDNFGYNVLMYYLDSGTQTKLNEKTFNYLIENSNLYQKSDRGFGYSALALAINSSRKTEAIKIIKRMMDNGERFDNLYQMNWRKTDMGDKIKELVEVVKTNLDIEDMLNKNKDFLKNSNKI